MTLTLHWRRAALCLLALTAVACARPGGQELPDTTATPQRVQTYTGVMPCADCPGIDEVLTLFPDGSYRMRLSYRERSAVFYELGVWALRPDGSRLQLSQAQGSREYQVLPTALRQLDQEGRAIASPFNFTLTLSETVDPIAEPMPLRGLFTWDGTAAWLMECESGQRFTVRAEETDPFTALIWRYRTAADLGRPVLVRVVGRFQERGTVSPTISVVSFEGVTQTNTCR